MYDAYGNWMGPGPDPNGPSAPNSGYLTPSQTGAQPSSQGVNWGQMLLTGVSAAIDSQVAQPYGLNNPVYNSQYGPGGVGQYPPGTTFDVNGNPILPRAVTGGTIFGLSPTMLIVGALILYLVMRRH